MNSGAAAPIDRQQSIPLPLDRTLNTTTAGSGGLSLTGTILGSGLFNKTGAGTLSVSGADLGTGAINVNLGTLDVNGATGTLISPTLNVNPGGHFADPALDNTGTNNNEQRAPVRHAEP